MKATVLVVVLLGLGGSLITADAEAALFGRRTRCYRQPIQCAPQTGGDAAQRAEGPISSLNAALGVLGEDLQNVGEGLAANDVASAQAALMAAQNSLTAAQLAAGRVPAQSFGGDAAQSLVNSQSSGGVSGRGRLFPRLFRCR